MIRPTLTGLICCVALIGSFGCVAPQHLLSRFKPAAIQSSSRAVANVHQPAPATTAVVVEQSVAPVSYIAEAGCPEPTCPSTNDTPVEAPCNAGCNAGCNICQGTGGCQSCNSQPFGYMPYPDGYFNPYLLDPNEFICDGGDNDPAAQARIGDQIVGVELEDTVVRYTTDAGAVHVQPSNKVCVYAPRFASVRKVTGAESGELAVGAIGASQPLGPIRAQQNLPGLAVTGRDKPGRGAAVRGPDAMRERNRGVPLERVLQPELAEDVLQVLANLAILNQGILRDTDKPWLSIAAQSAVIWSIEEEVAVTVNNVAAVTLTRNQNAEELVVYDFPDAGRLRICKVADKSDALPGDTVTFMIRVDNVGDSAVHDIVITDSLVTRLEYIADSQKSSAKATFTTDDNEGQSLRLTWKLEDGLKVGEGAVIEFKCKVR